MKNSSVRIAGVVIDSDGNMQPKKLFQVPDPDGVRPLLHFHHFKVATAQICSYKSKSNKVNESAMTLFGFTKKNELRGSFLVFRYLPESEVTVDEIKHILTMSRTYRDLYYSISIYSIILTDHMLSKVLQEVHRFKKTTKTNDDTGSAIIESIKKSIESRICCFEFTYRGHADPVKNDIPGFPDGCVFDIVNVGEVFCQGPRFFMIFAAVAVAQYASSLIEKKTWSSWNWKLTKL